MLYLKEEDYGKLLAYCRDCLPNEACGLLGGRQEEGKKYVEKLYFLTNMDADCRHFSMNPGEQFAAAHDMHNNGYELLGNFHSHPAAPPIPSDEDQRFAYDAGLSYLIVSLTEASQPEIKAFIIDQAKREVKEEPLFIIRRI